MKDILEEESHGYESVRGGERRGEITCGGDLGAAQDSDESWFKYNII